MRRGFLIDSRRFGLDGEAPVVVQHAGVVVGPNGHPRHLYRGFPGDHPAACRSRRLQMVTGAAMLVRRSVWNELGGLDTGFRNSYEDVDPDPRRRIRLPTVPAGRQIFAKISYLLRF